MNTAIASGASTRPDDPVVAGVGLADRKRKSRWPARLDYFQSGTGLVLALFMWGHMAFVSTILVSRDFMWAVTKMFEGYFVFGTAYPRLVSFVVGGVFAIFVVHALLAMRKFPINVTQLRLFASHRRLLAHEDTTLWWVQAITGFMLFFLASAHLVQMLLFPGAIGPYDSGVRVHGGWWLVYLVLLFAVELHGGIGLYRLAVKWDWFRGGDPAATRRNLRRVKWAITAFFLALGLLTLAAYWRIGAELGGEAKPYVPTFLRTPPQGEVPFWFPQRLLNK